MEFPGLIKVNDYHELDCVRDILHIFRSKGCKSVIKYVELGLDEDSRKYVGCFYIGRPPSKQTITKLLDIHNINIMR